MTKIFVKLKRVKIEMIDKIGSEDEKSEE